MVENIYLPDDPDLDIKAFENMLELNYLQNSYKLFWFYGILEEIKRGNDFIPFRKIVIWMIAKSWYMLLKFKLHFGHLDQLTKIVKQILDTSDLSVNSNEDEIIKYFDKSDNELIFEELLSLFYKFVPYRLLSPFYPELRGIKDAEKNFKIVNLSNKNEKAIYKIDEYNKYLTINKKWFRYIFYNQTIIEGWLFYKLVFFLQNRNPSTPSIIFKLSPPKLRNLSNAQKIWKEFILISPSKNIYNQELLSDDDFSIDHFIPWSFVLHDKIWNLLPVTRSINSQKSDFLPDLNKYLEPFITIQYQLLLNLSKNKKSNNKPFDDYLDILPDFKFDYNYLMKKETDFKLSLRNTIQPLHTLANNQGFLIWNR